jgi:23S rRNA U2552 (ribose-2'-O)-methylase RlmE/FtsJ
LFLRAVAVAVAFGAPASAFVGKLFMGGGFEECRAALRQHYVQVRAIRPEGTRRHSVEIFLIGLARRS